MRGTSAQGYVNPALTDHGRLRNGQDVLLVPLGSGDSGGVFYVLPYLGLTRTPRFAGYLASRSGHLQVSIVHGTPKAITPLYAAGDAQCCPSKIEWKTTPCAAFTWNGWVLPCIVDRHAAATLRVPGGRRRGRQIVRFQE